MIDSTLCHEEATFQQYLHVEYISFSRYNIPEILFPIMISLVGLLLSKKLLRSGSHHLDGVAVAIVTWLAVTEIFRLSLRPSHSSFIVNDLSPTF